MPPNALYNTGAPSSTELSGRKVIAEKSAGYAASADVNAAALAAAKKKWRQRKVTRIHGQWYDVTSFSHPGGPFALSLGVGRDSTILFESSHPVSSRTQLAAFLDKHRVDDSSQSLLDAMYPAVIQRSDYDFGWKSSTAELRGFGVRAEDGGYYGSVRQERPASVSAPADNNIYAHTTVCLFGNLLCTHDMRCESCERKLSSRSSVSSENGSDADPCERATSPSLPSSPGARPAACRQRSGSVSPASRSTGEPASRAGSEGEANSDMDEPSLQSASSASLGLGLRGVAGGGRTDRGVAGGGAGILYPASASSSAQAGWEAMQDPFERDLKALVSSYFRGEAGRRGVSLREATKAPWLRWCHMIGLAAGFWLLGVPALLSGWWPSLLLTPTLAWVWMVNHWHDAAHFAWSSDWRVNAALTYLAPWFSSPLIWYHQHVIGHHVYTNVPGKDPDMYHAPKFWRFTGKQRWSALHAVQPYTTPLLWAVSVPTLLLLKPLVTLATGVYNRAVPLQALPAWRVALHLAGRAAVAASLYVWPWYVFPRDTALAAQGALGLWGWAKPAAFSALPIAVYSLWFMACSQVNHHTGENEGQWNSNWFRHQVLTSHSVSPPSALGPQGFNTPWLARGWAGLVQRMHCEAAFWLSGGLNLQIEHHLLPTVNHWHLRQLQPAIKALCVQHGVQYCESEGIGEAFGKLWRHLAVMGEKPSPGRGDKDE